MNINDSRATPAAAFGAGQYSLTATFGIHPLPGGTSGMHASGLLPLPGEQSTELHYRSSVRCHLSPIAEQHAIQDLMCT